jgi:hypothetical protein
VGTKENKHFSHLDPDRVTYFGIYSKFWVCESLDGCVGDLGPGKIPEFVKLIPPLLPAILSLVFHAASLGAFEIWYHSDALRWKIPVAGITRGLAESMLSRQLVGVGSFPSLFLWLLSALLLPFSSASLGERF